MITKALSSASREVHDWHEPAGADLVPELTILPYSVAELFDNFRKYGPSLRVLAGITLLVSVLPALERVNIAGVPSPLIQAQTTCETTMLRQMGAREVFSGKLYEVLAEVARVYGRPIPHIYAFPGGFNMGYIAGSTAVDGLGKIVAGRRAIALFDTFSLKGFLGHEMAHLVRDSAAQGCNDYILRNPLVEADADALAARTLGTGPVKAFLRRVLLITHNHNWDAKQRLKVLQ